MGRTVGALLAKGVIDLARFNAHTAGNAIAFTRLFVTKIARLHAPECFAKLAS